MDIRSILWIADVGDACLSRRNRLVGLMGEIGLDLLFVATLSLLVCSADTLDDAFLIGL